MSGDMNIHKLFAEQHKISMAQYQETADLVNKGYEDLMKAEAESFARQNAEHERRMAMYAGMRDDQIAALKQQYAIEDSQ